jgi:transcription elongation factor Elf1
MSQCSNCNQTLTCGCQKRNASNGVQVCSNCLSSYESQIKNVNQPSVVIEEKSIIQHHRRGQALRKFIK